MYNNTGNSCGARRAVGALRGTPFPRGLALVIPIRFALIEPLAGAGRAAARTTPVPEKVGAGQGHYRGHEPRYSQLRKGRYTIGHIHITFPVLCRRVFVVRPSTSDGSTW